MEIELLSAMLSDKSMPGMPDPKTLFGEGDSEQKMANLNPPSLDASGRRQIW